MLPPPGNASTPPSLTPTSSPVSTSSSTPTASSAIDLTPPGRAKRPKTSPTTLDMHRFATFCNSDGAQIHKTPTSKPFLREYKAAGFSCSLKYSGCANEQGLGRHYRWHEDQGHVLPLKAKKSRTESPLPTTQLKITAMHTTFASLTAKFPSTVSLFASPHPGEIGNNCNPASSYSSTSGTLNLGAEKL